MKIDIVVLFFNVMLTIVVAGAMVHRILRREYRPVIRRLEREGRADAQSAAAGKRDTVQEHRD